MAVITPVADHERVRGVRIRRRLRVGCEGYKRMHGSSGAEGEALLEKTATAQEMVGSAHEENYSIDALKETKDDCECMANSCFSCFQKKRESQNAMSAMVLAMHLKREIGFVRSAPPP